MCNLLVQAAAKTLDEGSNILHGIEMCNEVLHGKGPDVGPEMQHECLCIRAAFLLKVHYGLFILCNLLPKYIKHDVFLSEKMEK